MPIVRRIIPALAALIALAAAAPAGAAVKEIGDTPAFPGASCPTNCQAIGQVTGYQVQTGSKKNPMQISKPGKIVAFTVALGKPNKQQTQFFNNLFGNTPQVRLSILSLGHRKRQATLTAQSEVFNVAPYFGSTPTFALSKPLPVTNRSVVALTVPTWAPAFAVNLGNDQAWRSSRNSSKCDDVQQPSAQQTVKTTRSYSCFYRTARLLYSATYIPNPTPTTTSKTTSGKKRH
jgi:hypothetical protein